MHLQTLVQEIGLGTGRESLTVVPFGDRSLALLAPDYVILVRLSDGLCERFTYQQLGFKE